MKNLDVAMEMDLVNLNDNGVVSKFSVTTTTVHLVTSKKCVHVL